MTKVTGIRQGFIRAVWAWPALIMIAGGGLQVVIPYDLRQFGLIPGDWQKVLGIWISAGLHKDAIHFFSNLSPCIMFSWVIFRLIPNAYHWIQGVLWTCSGLMLFLLGSPEHVHIGASIWIYGMAGMIIVGGLASGNFRLSALGVGLLAVFSGLIVGLDPRAILVSWEGHLYGLIAGGITGIIFRHLLLKPLVKKVEEDEENEVEGIWEAKTIKIPEEKVS
ncbi:MAG: rhomboid family intramembrane serine protease [Sphingobacteriia bacterium]|nr:rhomboid family intramembrane serine protease [Sphingobacteriia bacterium]